MISFWFKNLDLVKCIHRKVFTGIVSMSLGVIVGILFIYLYSLIILNFFYVKEN